MILVNRIVTMEVRMELRHEFVDFFIVAVAAVCDVTAARVIRTNQHVASLRGWSLRQHQMIIDKIVNRCRFVAVQNRWGIDESASVLRN